MHVISCPGNRGRQIRTVKRRRAALATTAIVPLLLAGCGGSSPTSTTGQDPTFQSIAAAAVKYSQCMREHGVPNFPDPKISSSPGHASVGIQAVAAGGGTPQFKVAQAACHSIMPGPSSSDLASPATRAPARTGHPVLRALPAQPRRRQLPRPRRAGAVVPGDGAGGRRRYARSRLRGGGDGVHPRLPWRRDRRAINQAESSNP